MRIALYQPDIPQNTGNICRLAACFGAHIDIINPAGFFIDDKKFKRSLMDYYKYVDIKRHADWNKFYKWSKENSLRLILLTTKGKLKYINYKFKKNDILILGRESAGVPKKVHNIVHQKLIIPMNKGPRSLNVSSAAAIVLSEAYRQLNMY